MFQSSLRIALAALDRPTTPEEWLRVIDHVHAESGFWWLDSALPDARLGRHSFAGSDPYCWLRAWGTEVEIDVRRDVRPGMARGAKRFEADPIETARSLLPRPNSLVYSTRNNLDGRRLDGASRQAVGPRDVAREGDSSWHEVGGFSDCLALPFLGGAVGYFGYELAGVVEKQLQFENEDDLGLPDLSLAFVDEILVYDHENERLWVVGLGFEDSGSSDSLDAGDSAVVRSRAIVDARAARVAHALRLPRAATPLTTPPTPASTQLTTDQLPVASTADVSGYAKAVDAILEQIAAGNVYQANYSQRLTVDGIADPWPAYCALRTHNPAPFGGYLSLSGAAILSSSPEGFLRLDSSRVVESRPIKGTCRRGEDEQEDARLAAELLHSQKDRAENLMIVDLVRNDLGRVCAPGSISVPELMAVEAYAAVLHLVSTISGSLEVGRDAFDLLRATFPPGSMTGAPKLASMALLEELESVRRGVYAGAIGYLDFRGGLDLAVVIRTIVWKDGRSYLHVGGGVVADSTPEAEFFESLDKAKAPLAALNAAVGLAPSRPEDA